MDSVAVAVAVAVTPGETVQGSVEKLKSELTTIQSATEACVQQSNQIIEDLKRAEAKAAAAEAREQEVRQQLENSMMLRDVLQQELDLIRANNTLGKTTSNAEMLDRHGQQVRELLLELAQVKKTYKDLVNLLVNESTSICTSSGGVE